MKNIKTEDVSMLPSLPSPHHTHTHTHIPHCPRPDTHTYTHTLIHPFPVYDSLYKSTSDNQHLFKFVGIDSFLPEYLTETDCDHKCQNYDIPGCLPRLPGLSGVGHHSCWIIISQCSFARGEDLEWVLSHRN